MNQIRVAMNVTLTNMFFYCTACKTILSQWRMTSTDPFGIMFVELFREKYLLAMDKYVMVILTCIVCRGST